MENENNLQRNVTKPWKHIAHTIYMHGKKNVTTNIEMNS